MKSLLAILIYTSILVSCKDDTQNNKENQTINDPDQANIFITVNNVYHNIVVDSNTRPDFKTIKEQFVSNARLGYIKNDSLILRSPGDYFDQMERMLAENNVDYLKEWEIQGETKRFGNIAQRTSLYGVHFNTTDSLAEKGIINFQLVKINDEWKILSMIWESQNKGLSVPVNYFD